MEEPTVVSVLTEIYDLLSVGLIVIVFIGVVKIILDIFRDL